MNQFLKRQKKRKTNECERKGKKEVLNIVVYEYTMLYILIQHVQTYLSPNRNVCIVGDGATAKRIL